MKEITEKYTKRIMSEINDSKNYIKMTNDEKIKFYMSEKELAEKEAPAMIEFFGGWLDFEEFDRIKSAPARWSKEEIAAEVAKKLANH